MMSFSVAPPLSLVAIEADVAKVVIGQADAIRLLLISILARGHALLEGDVGIGKTTMLRAFARTIGGGFARIEGSIDMMPGDLLYHTFITEEGSPRVSAGPLIEHGEIACRLLLQRDQSGASPGAGFAAAGDG